MGVFVYKSIPLQGIFCGFTNMGVKCTNHPNSWEAFGDHTKAYIYMRLTSTSQTVVITRERDCYTVKTYYVHNLNKKK